MNLDHRNAFRPRRGEGRPGRHEPSGATAVLDTAGGDSAAPCPAPSTDLRITGLEELLGIDGGPPVVEEVERTVVASRGDSSRGVICARGLGPLEWLAGPDCRVLARPAAPRAVGEVFATFHTPDGKKLHCVDDGDGRVMLPFSPTDAFESYVLERWTGAHGDRWLTPRQLNLYYRVKRVIPRRLQLAARRRLIAWKGNPEFPRWPHDDSVERLARFYGTCVLRAMDAEQVPFRWFWPNGMAAAAILTHDIEGPSGMRNAVHIADLEEERGFRSCFNIVRHWYPIDWGVVRELSQRGHEIGSHALYHDRSLFSSRASFEQQLPLLREAVSSLGAVGFRSPAIHRVPDWLGELPVQYDTTMPLSDPYEAQPGGVCCSWPFFIGNVLELPYTLPQDHTLFNLMGHRNPDPWIDQMRRIKRSYGLIQCLSHPDDGYLGDRRNELIYRAFLDALREEEGIWHTLPREVCNWWRARAQGSSLPGLSLTTGTIVKVELTTLAELRPPSSR